MFSSAFISKTVFTIFGFFPRSFSSFAWSEISCLRMLNYSTDCFKLWIFLITALLLIRL